MKMIIRNFLFNVKFEEEKTIKRFFIVDPNV